MTISKTKANRLLQIEALLLEHSEGMTQAEIARRLGVNRSTITRYLPDLPAHFYFDDLDGNRWKIDRSAYLLNVRFTLHEATAVHLAARLLSTCIDRHNPHAAAALRKLAHALECLAPHLSHHLAQSADKMDEPGQREDPVFLGVLEKLTLAWATGRQVQVWHRHEKSDEVYRYTFEPYFIEPYAQGHSIHAIGWSQSQKGEPKKRTFKIERIERVEFTNERYTIPDDFDPFTLLKDAWGIWYTDGEPVQVSLRFSPRVAKRVQENCWHPSERTISQPDGSLLWSAQIAEPLEMLPWVRGWGSDVEVLEPEEMRGAVIEEVKALQEKYHLEEC